MSFLKWLYILCIMYIVKPMSSQKTNCAISSLKALLMFCTWVVYMSKLGIYIKARYNVV